MVIFDSNIAGTQETDWLKDKRLDDLPSLNLAGIDQLVIVAAHADDETLGAGGLIRHCSEREIPIRIICVTDGEKSHPGDPLIASRRRQEIAAAVNYLAEEATIEYLGFADGRTREEHTDIRKALHACFESTSPRAAIATAWRGDGHRDHRVVGEIVAELSRGKTLLEFPIWFWHWGSPGDPDTPWGSMRTLDIDPAIKKRALELYVSQTEGEAPILRRDFLEHFTRDHELFIVNDRPLTQDYFDALYVKSSDPWRFKTRWYEQRKRELTLSSLPKEKYSRGLEIGCSIGMLSKLLASRADELICVDISEEAVDQTRELVSSDVTVQQLDVLQGFPPGHFDLIVLSEVGYYWGHVGLRTVLGKIEQALTRDGVLVACHWLHEVDDYPLSGEEVHLAIAQKGWKRIVSHREKDFLLEVWSATSSSVAENEGLA